METDLPVISLSDSQTYTGSAENLRHINKPEGLFCCMYTSGTSGNPKGVLASHKNVVSDTFQFINEMDISEETISLQQANYTFDMFTEEVYPTLIKGGTVIMVPKEVILKGCKANRFINENKITLMHTTPLVMQEITKYGPLPSVKNYIIGGEALYMSQLAGLAGGKMKLYNAYGPTEGTVISTFYRITDIKRTGICPIGHPISNAQVYIMRDGRLCGIGIPGELCIAGDGAALGYLNQPSQTAEKFIKNPFKEGCMYQTGDLTNWKPCCAVLFRMYWGFVR